ncbi:MAG TPA: hypothetical protein VMI54_00550 [Polyangiaceae bacterium]|nr:hypothetical protein [Polyangiaceae bacterium]
MRARERGRFGGSGHVTRAGALALCGAVALACGGESRRTIDEVPTPSATETAPAPSSTAAPSATDTSPPAPSTTAPAPTVTATSVPPTMPPPNPPSCPDRLEIDVDPSVSRSISLSNGITVEPEQEPTFPPSLIPPPGTMVDANPDPSTWDRSALPAGACVFRLVGVNGDCYPRGGQFFTDTCGDYHADAFHVSPGSFYEVHDCNETPGCPSAEPYVDAPGYWWYLANTGIEADGTPFTDLVICAPECANSFTPSGGCLILVPNTSTCN